VSTPGSIALFTHTTVEDTAEGVAALLDAAGAAGIEVRVPPAEAEKHGIESGPGVVVGEAPSDNTDIAVVLGGDGTTLTTLRACAVRDVPVFSINYGAIGFLSTVDHGELEEGIRRILSGDFEILAVPGLEVQVDGARQLAVNDASFHRRPDERVAELAYSVEGEELGRVRCDGLVASTPVGSTGYNLANGGPVLAWKVEGFVVSFVAPHTLTARALVVDTETVLEVENLSRRNPVDVSTDGRSVATLASGDRAEVRFCHDRVFLAQLPGSNFYHRLREKFGRLAY
jgi:NAD+ kinase